MPTSGRQLLFTIALGLVIFLVLITVARLLGLLS